MNNILLLFNRKPNTKYNMNLSELALLPEVSLFYFEGSGVNLSSKLTFPNAMITR